MPVFFVAERGDVAVRREAFDALPWWRGWEFHRVEECDVCDAAWVGHLPPSGWRSYTVSQYGVTLSVVACCDAHAEKSHRMQRAAAMRGLVVDAPATSSRVMDTASDSARGDGENNGGT